MNDVACDPGMKGCVLFGRFAWADESKNRPAGLARRKQEANPGDKPDEPADSE